MPQKKRDQTSGTVWALFYSDYPPGPWTWQTLPTYNGLKVGKWEPSWLDYIQPQGPLIPLQWRLEEETSEAKTWKGRKVAHIALSHIDPQSQQRSHSLSLGWDNVLNGTVPQFSTMVGSSLSQPVLAVSTSLSHFPTSQVPGMSPSHSKNFLREPKSIQSQRATNPPGPAAQGRDSRLPYQRVMLEAVLVLQQFEPELETETARPIIIQGLNSVDPLADRETEIPHDCKCVSEPSWEQLSLAHSSRIPDSWTVKGGYLDP